MLVDEIVEIVGCFGEGLGDLGLADFLHDLRLDRFHRRRLRGLDLVEANDVIPVLRLHWSADVADFHRESRFVERFDHQSTGKEAEIATLLRGTGILGKLRRELTEFLRVRFDLFE